MASSDEFDFRLIAETLYRNRLLIAIISGASFLFGTINAFTSRPVWEGEFQIVLERQSSNDAGRLAQLAASNPLLSSLAGISKGGRNQLRTEVKILESPSVLRPTYDFVKSAKAKVGEDVSDMTFRDWRDGNLKIYLEKGTTILNITYRDTQADLILPVLRRISNDYQTYSGRDRSKSIRNGLHFAENQVKKFRNDAAISSRSLDTFAIRYGISNSGNSVVKSDISKLLSATSLTSPDSSSPVKTQGDAYRQLASINQELIRRQQRFTDLDPGARVLIRERDALRRYIELTAGGSLTLPGKQPTSKEEAQEIILQYNELHRKAKRDIAALNSLESSLLSLQLEKARQTDPWELISTPTLLDQPVAPRKVRILAFSLLAGIVIGSGAALFMDRRTGLVFSTSELKALLPCPLLKHLPSLTPAAWIDAADLLAKGPLATGGSNPVALVPVGDVPADQLLAFAAELRRALGGRELVVSNDLRQTNACATQLLLTSPGIATRTQLSELNQKLALQGTPLAGWVLLDPKLKLS